MIVPIHDKNRTLMVSETTPPAHDAVETWISDYLQIYPKFSPAANALARLLEAGLRDKEEINQAMGSLGFSVPNLDLMLQSMHLMAS
ncbi:MAG: hypothetical protein HYR55_05020 [Acidobacteria bacterium]|nr:hypothetical protein [Acidobacteriota bacterium]